MKFDAIILGTGQSGPALAKKLASEGKKVAIIEEKKFGGTCVNVGCSPTKVLVAEAKLAHIRGKVDFKAVKARKDKIVKEGTEWVKKTLQETPGITVYEGHGAFISPSQIQVGNTVLESDQIYINVGGRAKIPKEFEGKSYLTNETILELQEVPNHLVIVGGGYIALEFAQIFRRFGSKVTVVQRGPRIMDKEDEDISQAILEILKKEGIEFYLNAKEVPVKGSHLLLAVGRVPNTENLGLENGRIAVDEHGYIKVDDRLKTTNPKVWALGDCNGKGAFTHTSYNDFEIVTNPDRKASDRFTTYALYTDPPLGRVGMTEKEARASTDRLIIGKWPMEHVSRAREMDETEGFLKILVNGETKQILGAAFLGVKCDEVVQLIYLTMMLKAPYTELQKIVGIHPTVTEYIPSLLGNLK